jgi:hypothetical protein
MARIPREMDRHHRLPRSRGGSNEARNISIVERKLHVAWHLLVGNMNAQETARMLSDTWIDPNYYLVAVPRHKPPKKKRRKRRYCVDCECEVLKHIPSTTKGE